MCLSVFINFKNQLLAVLAEVEKAYIMNTVPAPIPNPSRAATQAILCGNMALTLHLFAYSHIAGQFDFLSYFLSFFSVFSFHVKS